MPGIEVLRTHFSAIKSQAKKKGDSGTGRKPGRKSREAAPAVGGDVASPPAQRADADIDLLETPIALEPPSARMGVGKVEVPAELLG